MTSDLMIIILKVGMLKGVGVPIFNGMYLRRTGYFLSGGGGEEVNHLPQKLLQVT